MMILRSRVTECDAGNGPNAGPSMATSSGRNQMGHSWGRQPIILPCNPVEIFQPSRDSCEDLDLAYTGPVFTRRWIGIQTRHVC
jgi:hypothetical protein